VLEPKPGEPGHIRVDRHWLEAHIHTVTSPDLNRLTRGKNWNATLNRGVIPDFLDLMRAYARVLEHTLVWSGSFNPRLKRGSSEPSAHAGGWAFDVWADTLPLGHSAPGDHPVLQFQELARKHRWVWGGLFQHRVDPMHFQHESCPLP
jgi:hypothetical protein